MAVYQAKSGNALSFEVSKDDQSIGNLSYKSWFKFNAVIELANNSIYQIEPKGFWGTTIELKNGENVLLQFKMNWNGEIIIQTYFDTVEEDYVFKHRGVLKESFTLTDKRGSELLVMKPHFKWNKMNYEYEITTSETFDALPDNKILLMNALHCANYYMSMMMSSMGV